MKVRIEYTVEVSDLIRRGINIRRGTDGLATREDVKNFYHLYGMSMEDDVIQMAQDEADADEPNYDQTE